MRVSGAEQRPQRDNEFFNGRIGIVSGGCAFFQYKLVNHEFLYFGFNYFLVYLSIC